MTISRGIRRFAAQNSLDANYGTKCVEMRNVLYQKTYLMRKFKDGVNGVRRRQSIFAAEEELTEQILRPALAIEHVMISIGEYIDC